ncbi:MAG: glycoside hydrolase family 25 protein [Pseudomonadota bacterium]
MAKTSRQTKRTRRRTRRAGGLARRLLQLGALILLAAMAYAGWFWHEMRTWRPDEALYPEQGAVIASGASGIRFETLKATGAAFVYLELAPAGAPPDPGFRARLRAAKASGLKVGILQPFNPCLRADPQSARFTRMVARDPELLPAGLALTQLPDQCEPSVSGAAVMSEVLTLVNQMEMHAGQPVILKLGKAFETRFRLADALDRDIWLARDGFLPRYAQRPWLLWSANRQMVSEASAQPVEWVVVQR